MKRISGKEMCKVLERHGWRLTRIRSSRHIYRMRQRQPITVPVHGNQTLRIGTQRDIMKNAGLTDADL